MAEVYSFGQGIEGQLGLGSDEDAREPREITELRDKGVTIIAAGARHSAAINNEGILFTWGNNEHGELGRSRRLMVPQRVDALEAMKVVDVACGDRHTLCAIDNGSVYAFGGNDKGQLGQGDFEPCAKPRLVKEFDNVPVCKVAAGSAHSLCLSRSGDVYAFGDGSYGQLGKGDMSLRRWPVMVEKLVGLPIINIVCGGQFSAALSQAHNVYTWGDNRFGQLGTGSFESGPHTSVPALVKPLRGKMIVQIVAGATHMLARSSLNNLYSWGGGNLGQLGTGQTQASAYPVPLEAFRDVPLGGMACGRLHSVAYRRGDPPPQKIIYTWGANSNGQLGHSESKEGRVTPLALSQSFMQGRYVRAVACGADHTLAIIGDSSSLSPSSFHHQADMNTPLSSSSSSSSPSSIHHHHHDRRVPSFLTLSEVRKLVDKVHLGSDIKPLLSAIQVAFSSPSVLNGSFLLSDAQQAQQKRQRDSGSFAAVNVSPMAVVDDPHTHAHLHAHFTGHLDHHNINKAHSINDASINTSGVDMEAVREVYRKLISLNDHTVINVLMKSIDTVLVKSRGVRHEDPESLRMFLIIMENPLLLYPDKTTLSVMEHLTINLQSLSPSSRDTLRTWWESFPSEYFVKIVDIFNRFLEYVVHGDIQPPIVSATQIVSDLYNINRKYHIVPHERFYNRGVSESRVLEPAYLQWRQNIRSNPHVFSYLSYPFLLSPQAKEFVLHRAAELAQHDMVEHSVVQTAHGIETSPYLVLVVRRGPHLIADASSQLLGAAGMHAQNLLKPLKVVFSGEEGVDEGGVKKEFFQLLIKGIFAPEFGMFKQDEQSRLFWFNADSFEDSSHFTLVGGILGLAIYNKVILDIHFPQALYKKLLGVPVGLSDLAELHPALARGLAHLLDYKEGDDEDVFGMTFRIQRDSYGETKYHDLKKDGENIPVTAHNKQEFVELYSRYLLNEQVQGPFQAFRRGFMLLMDSYLLKLFRPDELELLICGSREDIDMNELRKGAVYAGGFDASSPVVLWFWKILNDLSSNMKKQFLIFATGSDRIPIQGLASLRLVLQRNGPDSDRLPTASTCYHVLLLPEYPSMEKLKERLLYSINNPEGFGLA